MEKPYQKEAEEQRTSAAIEDLARSQGLGIEEVKSLYESVFAEMKQEAIITDFLHVLAARKVREILQRARVQEET
jgi:hypothetical protein